MAKVKWKIFTNEKRTRFVVARHGGFRASVVYDGGSEVEALRALVKATIWTDATPVERNWADMPEGTYGLFETGRRKNEVNTIAPLPNNWWPSIYEDNK
jgi:hypothetical protein